MKLKDLLQEVPKAQLQGYYLHWMPGREMVSARERLVADLLEAMTDHTRARQLFESLPRAQKAFVVALLVRDAFSGTVADVRAHKYGKAIEDFEVEHVLKALQEAGYIVKVGGTGGYTGEVFGIPEDVAHALRRTLPIEERHPMAMLSAPASRSAAEGGAEVAAAATVAESAAAKSGSNGATSPVDALSDGKLRKLAGLAIDDHLGILTLTDAGVPSLNRPEWRSALESANLGTTGILCLKDYGIDLEEEALVIYQEIVYDLNLARAQRGAADHDREISMGVDLIIDIDRALEVLRTETLEVTREGTVYRKIEEKLAGQFITASHPEFQDGSPLGRILDLCRRLQFFEEEGQRLTVDPLRRRVWRKKPLLRKVGQVFEFYRNEHRGQRWSFHQIALRDIFLDHLRRIRPGSWLLVRPFLSAVIDRYLLSLEEGKVASALQERCTGDFGHETLFVPLSKLYHDLSYWVIHRLALLGIVDVGYRGGVFHSLQLSRLGHRLLLSPENGADSAAEAEHAATERATRSDHKNGRILVHPDFEILMYPEAPDEAAWMVSFFAERIDSDRVKRYRLTRDSVKRGIVSGLTREEILGFLEAHAHGVLPPNVVFSLREWTDGVEVVRRQKVTLLRSSTPAGADRLVELLEQNEVPYERIGESAVIVRGGKSEKALEELQERFRDNGLFVE